jgi:O-antigen/teichoic acid export membrane protein
VRWCAALFGFALVRQFIGRLDWRRPFSELHSLRTVVPRFAGATVCFLALRNAGLVMLPSLADTAQAGYFGVSYQLADLAMLPPTVLALSSTFAMARGASTSQPHLRRTMLAMVLLLTVTLWPLVALAVALAEPVLSLLFGAKFAVAAPVLQLMMLATPLMAIDQVLSQGMVSDHRYHDDLVAVAVGALVAVALTALCAARWGAVGAALAFVMAMLASTAMRLWLMRDLRLARVFCHAVWRPSIAGAVAATLTSVAATQLFRSLDERWTVLWAIPGALTFLLCFGALGGFATRSNRRLLDFVRRKA